jgi:FixJ family two-component response regulator
MSRPTVYVVDDDDAVRDSIGLLLETAGLGVETFADAEAFRSGWRSDMVGCLLLDLCMPGSSGIDLQAFLVEQHSRLPIIFLTAHGDIPTTVRAVKAGAYDFLTKPVEGSLLLERVRGALASVADERRNDDSGTGARREHLTEREREVMSLALSGMSNKEIARHLDISYRTVEFHRSRILAKTGAASLLQLAGRSAN